MVNGTDDWRNAAQLHQLQWNCFERDTGASETNVIWVFMVRIRVVSVLSDAPTWLFYMLRFPVTNAL